MKPNVIKVASICLAMTLGWLLAPAVEAQEDSPASQPRDEQMGDRPPRHGKRGHGEMRGRPGHDGQRSMRRGERGRRPGMGRAMGRDQRPGGDKRRGGERMMKRMSKEDMAKVLQVVKDYDPDLARRIEQVRDRNPREAMQMMRHAAPMVRRWMHMKEFDSQGYELHLQDMKLGMQARKLGERIRKSGGSDEASADLREVLSQQFDVRQRQREHKLTQIEKKLENLRQSIQKRAAARDQLIDKEAARLTGQNAGEEF